MDHRLLIDKLNLQKTLFHNEWIELISSFTPDDELYARSLAQHITEECFGRKVFFRGLIEFTNICKNNCLYCGIRRDNQNICRYRLSKEEILECCHEGYLLGYRTFVLQGGEDGYLTDEYLIGLIADIKTLYPDCAITLSVGERSRESYEALYRAGADRYLLRHETADKAHYEVLHPKEMSFENRIRCLYDLKDIGFQTGCGMMVGSPYQTANSLAMDMELIRRINPHMVGIGPFIHHKDTPFAEFPSGSLSLTLFLLSLTRIMLPHVLLPSTTALGTVATDGRINGILAGCNVIMPNLSPQNVRKDYMLYNNKQGIELNARESLAIIEDSLKGIGRELVSSRGDHLEYRRPK